MVKWTHPCFTKSEMWSLQIQLNTEACVTTTDVDAVQAWTWPTSSVS